MGMKEKAGREGGDKRGEYTMMGGGGCARMASQARLTLVMFAADPELLFQ